MTPISRGFGGRRHDDVDLSRIPPGQYYERGFPVLSAGPTPRRPLRRASIRWHVATVRDARTESPTARTLVLDGYQASRSYSIASAPEHDRRRGLAPLMPLTRKCRAGEDWIQGGAG